MSLDVCIKQGTIISDINFGGEEGSEYASFILGYKRQYKKKDEEYPGSITIPVKTFRSNAVFLNKYFKKMDNIIVQGTLDKDDDYTNSKDELVTNAYFINATKFDFVDKRSDNNEKDTESKTTKSAPAVKASPLGGTKPASPFGAKPLSPLSKIGK